MSKPTVTAILTAIRTRSPGYLQVLQDHGRQLDEAERWVVDKLTQLPPESVDSQEVKTGTALGALSLTTVVSRLNTTGAATASLANGVEGQFKFIVLETDGGDVVITPASIAGGATITLNDAEEFVGLVFLAGKWRRIVGKEVTAVDSVNTVTGTGALGALSLETEVTLVVTTGAATATLAAGYEGQRKTIKLKTDGGDFVLTPSALVTGTTLTFNDANDTIYLQFFDGKWNVIVNSGVTVA